jgi:hypothetical protein
LCFCGYRDSVYERIAGLLDTQFKHQIGLVRPEEHDPHPIGLSLSHQHPGFGLLQTYVRVHVICEYVKKNVKNGVAVYAAMVTVVGLHHCNPSPSHTLRIDRG